ncbi:hypothetical protein OQY15_04520 [Pedobacter sp. MC2016-15]|uniref:hypothetical protein n=1 Tax=Pedobacter sp. MC2016-15 TaxID=2994473 RepID=UPI002245CA56|nr:hypothetical protein [Pedobacter sp. MC2016-15]MCX2478341.1 hypothetical protein [Pedobacter sp. MC2016-15]
MNEDLFLKGQRVITPDGDGEVVDSIGHTISVKLDSGDIKEFEAEDLRDDNSAG